jgi:5-methylcytosine-specific restriction protein A
MPVRPPLHRPAGAPQSEAERQRRVDMTRGSSTSRLYGYRWQQERKRFLQQHPLCVHCLAKGVITAATVVDHRKAHRGDRTLFWDKSNWDPCCKPCHDAKPEAAEGDGDGGVKTSKPSAV